MMLTFSQYGGGGVSIQDFLFVVVCSRFIKKQEKQRKRIGMRFRLLLFMAVSDFSFYFTSVVELLLKILCFLVLVELPIARWQAGKLVENLWHFV